MSAPAPPESGLGRSLVTHRAFLSFSLSVLTGIATFLALVPLVSVLVTLVLRGGRHLRWSMFTELPPTANVEGGGFGNALVGTAVMVGLAVLLAVPMGVMAAVYLTEFARNARSSDVIRFAAKVLSGIPSILTGVVAFAIVVLTMKTFTAIAGGFALALLMLPTVVLTAEQALHQVPMRMREAAVGLGGTPFQVAFRITLPTALPSILTGVMLAVSRAAGETAPLLFTAAFSNFWIRSLGEETSSMAVLIYKFARVPYANQIEMAWAASLVLVVVVLMLNIAGRMLTKSSR